MEESKTEMRDLGGNKGYRKSAWHNTQVPGNGSVTAFTVGFVEILILKIM